MCSNETVNIWTHLIGAVWFMYLTIYDNQILLPSVRAKFEDHIVMTSFEICFEFCLLFSSGYHTFSCYSEEAYRRWFALDLAGISMSLCGCYIPSLYYAFYCHVFWRSFYTGSIALFIALNLFLHIHPKFLSKRWTYRRLTLYIFIVLFGVIPACHWFFLMGGWQNVVVKMFLPNVIVMYALGGLGAAFYVSKIPERFLPGRFDYIGASHQWWHLLVLGSFLWWHRSAIQLMTFRLKYGCVS